MAPSSAQLVVPPSPPLLLPLFSFSPRRPLSPNLFLSWRLSGFSSLLLIIHPQTNPRRPSSATNHYHSPTPLTLRCCFNPRVSAALRPHLHFRPQQSCWVASWRDWGGSRCCASSCGGTLWHRRPLHGARWVRQTHCTLPRYSGLPHYWLPLLRLLPIQL